MNFCALSAGRDIDKWGSQKSLLKDVREVSHFGQRSAEPHTTTYAPTSRSTVARHQRSDRWVCSEEDLTFGVFFLSKNEWLATADDLASADLAGVALELERNLLGGLCLLTEDGLGLAAETFLLWVVSSLALSGGGILALFVLGDLVDLVLLALHTVCVFLFRSMHLCSHVTHLRLISKCH